MKLKIVCVRDAALDAYERPFFVPSLGMAIRSFGDETRNKESPIAAHPEDFYLYEFGEFDTESGMFETYQPVQISRALDYPPA